MRFARLEFTPPPSCSQWLQQTLFPENSVVFVNTDGCEEGICSEMKTLSSSHQNPFEARIVSQIVILFFFLYSD